MTAEDAGPEPAATGKTPHSAEPDRPPEPAGTDGPEKQAGHAKNQPPDKPSGGSGLEDMLRPSGRRSAVVESVRAKAAFVGTTNIQSVVIAGDGRHYRVPLSDLVALHASTPFVPPPGYPELVQALKTQRIIACQGPDGCGKEMAVTRALLELGIENIRLLPANLSMAEMSRVVETAAEDGGACVLAALNQATLRALAGPPGQPLRALASSRRITVVAATAAPLDAAARRSFEVVSLGYPDASKVLDSYVAHRTMAGPASELAREALAELSRPLSPAVIAAVVDEAAARPDSSAAEIARAFDAAISTDALGTWIGEGRRPQEIAMLAAGASLSGTAIMVAQEQAKILFRALQPVDPSGEAAPALGGTWSWPTGFLRTTVEKVNTHFGIQPLEVIEISDPHRPQDVVQAMWRALGAEFQSRYCEWLGALPAVRQLRWHAAYTAGALFAIDPVNIEAQVLRPWALSRDAAQRRCAGIALGTPVAMGGDPTAARALAHAWAKSESAALQQAAVAAYGGLLGAWDGASAAPLKLFLIGQLTPPLRAETDWAMASLVVAGADAVGSRAWVIGYLKLVVTDRADQGRVFGCLPPIVAALAAPNTVCAESLAALRAEPDNWAGLLGLIGTAMVTPAGVAAGRECLSLLVGAAANGHIGHEVLEEVIRGMRASQRPFGTVSRLGSVIRRTLAALSRVGDEDVKGVAAVLMKRFFD
jgi:hypothetical protein